MCDFITDARLEPCKDSVGGIQAVYFCDYDLGIVITRDSDGDAITSVTNGASTPADLVAYKYSVKGTSSFTQNIQASRENGTVAFEQVLELQLHKLTQADHKEIKLLAWNRPRIVVEDYNGNLFLAGEEHGMDVSGGTIVTGAAMSDMSGYTLTFTGMETKPAAFITQDLDSAGFDVDETEGA
jgi:hypothetical protein